MAFSPDSFGDAALRQALLHRLHVRHRSDPGSLIVEELGLRHGKSRVDVAVVNGRVDGYEIKSRKDTLARLPAQVETYSLILDRATLLCDGAHIDAAVPLLPDWWGIMSAKVGPRGGITFSTLRRAKQNPSVDAASVIKLLWRDEALEFLVDLGEADGLRSASRRRLYQRLVDVLDLQALKTGVRARLKTRRAWRAGGLYRPNGDSVPL